MRPSCIVLALVIVQEMRLSSREGKPKRHSSNRQMASITRRVLVLIALLLVPSITSAKFDKNQRLKEECDSIIPCVCREAGNRGLLVDCKGRNLTSIPNGLPNRVAILDLSQNKITNVPARALANCTHLNHLLPALSSYGDGLFLRGLLWIRKTSERYLQGNNISQIHTDAFRNLRRLQLLDLKENLLKDWPRLSQDLPALQSLFLSNNKISSLRRRCLARIPNVLYLFLDYNRLTAVPYGLQSLPKLQHLNLHNNSITKLPRNAFKTLKQLVELKLAANGITEIEEDAFAGLPELVQLNLRGNRLRSIPTTAIKSLKRLQQLSLDGNPIKVIKDFAFKGLTNLTEISLTWEKLEKVQHNAFTQLPLLRRLPLMNVKLKQFPNLTGTNSLEILVLEANFIEHIPEGFCRMFPKLFDFNANMNRIKRIPDMSECKSLQLLKLVHNRISSIGLSLQGMESLKDLTLQGNHITEITSKTFKGVKHLETLNLADNRIDQLSKNAFSHFDKLRTLDLSHNSIRVLPTTGLHNVRWLYLNDNRNLKELPVEDLPRLKTIVAAYPYHCCKFRKKISSRRLSGNGEATVYEEDWRWATDAGHEYLRMDRPGWGNASFGSDDDELSGFGSGKIDPALHGDSETSGAGSEHAGYNITYVGSADDFLDNTNEWQREVNCTPLPGPFFPCNDLMGSWLLRIGVWTVFLLALLGNVTVILVILISNTKMDVSRFLIMNLATADMCMGLYLGLLAIVDASTIGDFLHHGVEWQLSSGCKAAGFLALLSSETSVFTLTIITIERFIAIRHALHIHKKMSLRKTTIVMICGWAVALVIATLPLAKISDYTKVSVCLPFFIGNTESLVFVTIVMILNVLAFLVICGCYVGIYLQVRGSNAWNSNDTQVALRMALLVATDLICWAPIAFLALSAAFGTTFVGLEEAKVFTVFCFPLNSCANPFLYAIFTAQFKKDCKTICRRAKNSPAPPKIRIELSKKRYSLSGMGIDPSRGSQSAPGVLANNTSSTLLKVPIASLIRRFSLPPEIRLGPSSIHLKPIPQELSRSSSQLNEQTPLRQEVRGLIEMETAC